MSHCEKKRKPHHHRPAPLLILPFPWRNPHQCHQFPPVVVTATTGLTQISFSNPPSTPQPLTIPPGVSEIVVELWGGGGGGGGGGATSSFAGAGGGAGGYVRVAVPITPTTNTFTLNVGMAGTGGTAGGATSFVGNGQSFTAGGGGGGNTQSSDSSLVLLGGAGGSGVIVSGGEGGFISRGQDGSVGAFTTSPGDGGGATSGGLGGRGTGFDGLPQPGSLPGGGGGGGGHLISNPNTGVPGAVGAAGLIVVTYTSVLIS